MSCQRRLNFIYYPLIERQNGSASRPRPHTPIFRHNNFATASQRSLRDARYNTGVKQIPQTQLPATHRNKETEHCEETLPVLAMCGFLLPTFSFPFFPSVASLYLCCRLPAQQRCTTQTAVAPDLQSTASVPGD